MTQLAMQRSTKRVLGVRTRGAQQKARTRSPRKKSPAGGSVRLWIRLTVPGVGQIGPGKVELLRQIREHQSISAAARARNMSYRRAWLLIEELNATFARPVVATWTGGRSHRLRALPHR